MIGLFLLSHPNIKFNGETNIYSDNEEIITYGTLIFADNRLYEEQKL